MNGIRQEVTGVVLCGGNSSRMGTNKALLAADGVRLIEHMIDALKGVKEPLPVDEVLLSGSLDGYNTIPDLIPERGPLGGVYSVMEYVFGRGTLDAKGQKRALCPETTVEEHLLVVPVDMPHLTSVVLARLVQHIEQKFEVVHFSESQLPLIIRVSDAIKEVILTRLSSGEDTADYSLKGFYRALSQWKPESVRSIELGDHKALINLNTQRDWKDFVEEILEQ